jgi:signal transduction histidine kinase
MSLFFHRRTAVRFFLLLIASIFIAEFLIMFLLEYARIPRGFINNLLDSVILVVVLYPILYGLVFRKIRIEFENEIKKDYDIQSALNSLLRLALKDIPLETLLEHAVDLILSIPWLAFESRGGIFLAEKNMDILEIKAQRGIDEVIQKACKRRPFGDCLCGLAASEQKTQFASRIDERHSVTYKGIIPHGHYCVPIIFGGRTLGVINIYVREGHIRNRKEEDFLIMVANALAGIIMRRRAEEGLREAYTKLQEMQDQLIQAEKLNAIGQLASGVAHEVRNPLGIILQGVEYLEATAPPKEKSILEAISMIKDSVKRADNIVALLLDFSKAARLNLKTEDINSILESSIGLVKTKFKFINIDIVKEMRKDIPKVLVDRNKMEQVFINILLNAIQAMPDGGRITVRSYDKKLEEAKNGIGRREEDYFRLGERAIIVEIEDTGIGIPDENLKKIFDPFFTTKGPRGGSGLGLSVSRNIVIMHRALMNAASKAGKGTKITIMLHAMEE